jgi:hypothetical protein
MRELNEQYKIMTSYQDQVEKSYNLPSDEAQSLFIKPITNLYHSLTKILTEN